MEAHIKLNQIIKKESYSRISSYMMIGDINTGKSSYLKTLEGVTYFDFEENAEIFFKNTTMTPLSFDLGKFFKEIKKMAIKSQGPLIVDNLEIIINILYSKDSDKSSIKRFFKDSVNQVYRESVIFVLSEVKEIWLAKCISGSDFPLKNVITWGNIDEN